MIGSFVGIIITFMKDLDQLRAFYDNELMEILLQFEARRKGIVKNITTTSIIVGAIALVIGLVGASQSGSPIFLLGAIIGAAVIIAIASAAISGSYSDNYKSEIIGRIVKFIDPELSYDPKRYISENTFLESRLYEHRSDRYDGEDCVSGMVGKTQIMFSELHSQYKTTTRDSKGKTQTHWHTIFKGVFFVADFNKHFNGSTIIMPDYSGGGGFLSGIGQFFQKFSGKGQLVKLEDPEFEKYFVVYGSDQVEARYILSPALMQRITEFRKRTGKAIRMSFINSNVYIAIDTNKNLFEPKLFTSVLDITPIQEYYQDMATFIGIVEDLNLNRRIWTKQ